MTHIIEPLLFFVTRPHPLSHLKQSAWQAIVGGSFGFTYGGQGIWWACYNASYVNGNCGQNGSPSYYVWYQTLNFTVGSQQMPLMKQILTSLPWWTLAPNASVIQWASQAPQDSQKPYQKAAPDASLVLAYLPQSNCQTYNGTLQQLQRGVGYRVQWINPRNGSRLSLYEAAPGPTIPFPPAPDRNDWVLLAEAQAGLRADELEVVQVMARWRQQLDEVRQRSWLSSGISLVTKINSLGSLRQGTGIGMNLTVGDQAITVEALGW